MGEGGPNLLSFSIPETWEREGIQASKEALGGHWLSAFQSEILDDLVAQAYRQSPNLRILKVNLDRSNAQSDRARSGLWPVINGLAGASRQDQLGGNEPSFASLALSLDASWEPDFWGRIRAGVDATEFQVAATVEDYESARQILAASVVESWFLAIEAQRLSEVSKKNYEALNKTLGFVNVQYERGLRSGQDIALIRADVKSAEASFKQAEGSARQAKRALEILIGIYPDTNRILEASLPDVPIFQAIGQPANILTQRPDLLAAQHRVRAAYSGQAAAKAESKPNLSLRGVIGGDASQLGQILDPMNVASTLFTNLTAPIFDGGLRQADIAIAKAEIDEAVASYQSITLDAFRDVEEQIDQGQILKAQEIALLGALSDAREALRFTQFRYESAESDLLNVLQVQQRVSFIEAQLVSTRRARLVQYLNLSLALGVTP